MRIICLCYVCTVQKLFFNISRYTFIIYIMQRRNTITNAKPNTHIVHPKNWNRQKEKLLRFWQEECRIYSWIYTRSADLLQLQQSVLQYISIAVSAISSIVLGSTATDECGEKTYVVIIMGAVFAAITFAINNLEAFGKFKDNIARYVNSSRQNTIIASDIESILNMNRDERPSAIEFLNDIKNRKNKILEDAPNIHPKRWKEFNHKVDRGEQIGFINHQSFKSYLDQTVNFYDLDFHDPPTIANTEEHTGNTSPTINNTVSANVNNIYDTAWNNDPETIFNNTHNDETDEKITPYNKQNIENTIINIDDIAHTHNTDMASYKSTESRSPTTDRRISQSHPLVLHNTDDELMAAYKDDNTPSNIDGEESKRTVTPTRDTLNDIITGNMSSFNIRNALQKARQTESLELNNAQYTTLDNTLIYNNNSRSNVSINSPNNITRKNKKPKGSYMLRWHMARS